jgi:hypothetical protein
VCSKRDGKPEAAIGSALQKRAVPCGELYAGEQVTGRKKLIDCFSKSHMGDADPLSGDLQKLA